MVEMDKEAMVEAYEDVRDDSSNTTWVLVSYDNNRIVVQAKGDDYDSLLEHFQDDQRCYAYVRVTCGDEMSKRAKFVFLQWLGPAVSPLKKAKTSTDKSFVKSIFTSFAIEILADEKSELSYDVVVDKTRRAGGANYGTGSR